MLRLCSAERTPRPERTSVGHVRGQCTLTLTDANVAFPEFCGQSNLNSARMLMQMFVIRFYCGIRSRNALKAGTFSSHSCSLAVHLHDPVGDSHRQKLKKCFKHNIFCSRALPCGFAELWLAHRVKRSQRAAKNTTTTTKACQCILGEYESHILSTATYRASGPLGLGGL